MSTELKTKMKNHSLTQFWGGDERGVCAQISPNGPIKLHSDPLEQIQENVIQLTMEEAAVLCEDLEMFVKGEANRRRRLLKSQIEQLKMADKTVFHEIVELPDGLFDSRKLAVDMVSRFCPKH